ncbi:hypothetical protein BKA62DRAFT_811265 [Auriculariales sp. MPI-PUGE-AT-0066]|nr:hypothetical protein BKA62DRAFT_811265 [Auriculariales sp. MPI-PUGE-AT-0066]
MANYQADASRARLVEEAITVTVEDFVQRAKSLADDHKISWDEIARLPELAQTNLPTTEDEKATADLLNAISTKVRNAHGNWKRIHWASIGRGEAPGGDFQMSLIMPNYRASIVEDDAETTTAATHWQKLVSTGEYESEGSSQGGATQMLHYLSQQLRYNPQLREGFARHMHNGDVARASAGDALIAYVILVYDACHRPIESVKLIPPAPASAAPQYEVSHEGRVYTFMATIAHSRPGRATFGGPHPEGSYFCKLSWQDNHDRSRSEQFFYDTAHGNGKDGLPGLARYTAFWVDTISVSANPYNCKEPGAQCSCVIIILSTVGDVITYCTDVEQSVCVMHDTIDVVKRLAGKDMMHRDLSFGNVLCNPSDLKEPLLTSPTCAEAVTNPDNRNPLPKCLVIDLDHAKLVEGGSTNPARFEVAGTELYMSSELLDVGQTSWLKGLIPTTFDDLQAALQDVFDQTAELFGDKKFLRRGDLWPIHTPRHDLESIFWVFSIFFASALPKGAENVPKPDLNRFMRAMRGNIRRESQFQSVLEIEDVLHPQLTSLAPLLCNIASLLFYIPWCLLPIEPKTTLAHDLVRYMLLAFLLDQDNSEILGTELETGVTRQVEESIQKYRTRISKRSGASLDDLRLLKRGRMGDRAPYQLIAR